MPRRSGESERRSFHNNAPAKGSRRARKRRGRKAESRKAKESDKQ